MTAPRRSWIAEALFGLGLLAYPRAFRRRFAAEMRDDFRRRRTLALGTLVRNGLAERWAAVVRWSFFPNATPHLYEPSGRHAMFWDSLRADVRFALRQALQAPLYTGLAVAALALGIGANSAIFTVVQSILLKPLPYAEPGQLVMVWSHNTKEQKPENPISPANFRDLRDEGGERWRRRAPELTSRRSCQHSAGRRRPAQTIVTSFVEPGLFALLGRTAQLGRTLREGDPAGQLVLSHDGYWQRRFGGDAGVIGKTMSIDNEPATIVGVTPPDFVFPYRGMVGPRPASPARCRSMCRRRKVFTGLRTASTSRVSWSRNVHYLAAVRTAGAGHERRNRRAPASRRLPRGSSRPIPTPTPGGPPRLRRCTNRWSDKCGRPCWCCSPGSGYSADGLRQRRQPGAGAQRQPAEGTGRCGPRSAPAACGSPSRQSPKACCSRSAAVSSACW